MILIIDNYDSFTYNLVQYMGELLLKKGGGTQSLQVCRNDQITLDEIATLAPKKIVISPGPCTPNEAGVSVSLIQKFAGQIPILGVCLGHQSIGAAFGGKIIRAKTIMHGKTSEIHHDGKRLFQGIPNPFMATRYHSLVIEKESLPDCLEITAWTDDGEIMGVRHKGIKYAAKQVLNQPHSGGEGKAPLALYRKGIPFDGLQVEGATRAPIINQPHSGGEGKAPLALPVEGATRAPIIEGVQFHPESILTVEGKKILGNFLCMP